jgi:ABC-type amino acid transport substrate-binding protein
MMRRPRLAAVAAALAAGMLAAPLGAQESRSAPQAAELARLLAARQVQYIAARDPDDEGRYVVAMYAPGPALLVLSAQYPVPAAFEATLAQGDCAKAYADLNGAGVADSKLFVHDIGANGLFAQARESGAFDIVYERVVKPTMFDGDWKAQGLREEDYQASYRAIDAKYARMLSLLLAELKKGGQGVQS